MPNVYTGSSDRWHDDYERGRPGWPLEVVGIPALPSAATALELGAGTGKLTRLLASKFDDVVAIEPDEGMRRLLVALCPQAQALAGSAEEIPLADDSVDAVFAAEAFHWFDGGRALAEIARVLRPRGALVLMWNLPAGPTEPSIEAVEQLLLGELGPSKDELGYDPLDLNTRRYASGEWRLAFAESPFEELQETRLPNLQTLDRDGLVAFLASMGWIADLPDEDRLPLLEKVRSLLTAAEYRRPWETHVHWTRLAAGGEGDWLRRMEMRLLTRDEVELIWTIDRSEVHHHIYELREGQLVRTPNYFEIPGWRPDAAAKETPVLSDRFDRGGTFVGVFDAEALVGMSVLESARVGRGGDQMQLAYLYVSRAYRGRGVGMQLFEAAVSFAREAGANALYVSATPTQNTVDFYLNRGCVLAPEPDPELLAAEPDDIHLLYLL